MTRKISSFFCLGVKVVMSRACMQTQRFPELLIPLFSDLQIGGQVGLTQREKP